MDGSALEEVATGFWNPFDLKFIADGRLLLTDNDPDSRGPNRLIEVVPGGDYGYKTLYGGSGIHPFLSWNGELPGTLPYAAPLGEAPCALIDAGFTNFGDAYAGQVLVNVWEEKNIVRIPLKPEGSSLAGKPEVLVQGDSLFHPVALAVNSKGELYITDWVIRQYPNHGSGKIWRLTSGMRKPDYHAAKNSASGTNRFAEINLSLDEMRRRLNTGDEFEKAIIRHRLAQTADFQWLSELVQSDDPELRLQSLLIFLKREDKLDKTTLQSLLNDREASIRKMALVYTGTRMRRDMAPDLEDALASGNIGPELFETYLAAVAQIQPKFIERYRAKAAAYSKDIPRRLPDSFIPDILTNRAIGETTRALALPHLEKPGDHRQMLLELLEQAQEESFQMGLLQALKQPPNQETAPRLLEIALSSGHSAKVRSQALLALSLQAENYCREVIPLLEIEAPAIAYAAVKYLCRCAKDASLVKAVDKRIRVSALENINALRSSWNLCKGNLTGHPQSNDQWRASVRDKGNAETGRLVFEAPQNQCLICHRVNGWGGAFGPDLSHIGSSKSRWQLVDAILDPSLEIAPEWQGWYVTDREGKTHYGRQIDVHFDHAELMNAAGLFDRYDHPKSFGISERSLMPEGLQQFMTPEEFNDLIAYLMSLK